MKESARQARLLAGDRLDFCQSQTVWPERRFHEVSAHAGSRQREVVRGRRGCLIFAGRRGDLSRRISHLRECRRNQRTPRGPLAPRTFSRRCDGGDEIIGDSEKKFWVFWEKGGTE